MIAKHEMFSNGKKIDIIFILMIAITRNISSNINNCELTHISRAKIDVDVACLQHDQYTKILSDIGCKIIKLEQESDLPDSVFVEDIAIILDEIAIITLPKISNRRKERDTIINALKPYKSLLYVTQPAIIDGGDVLVIGKNIFIGLSSRTNQIAIDQINDLLYKYDYKVVGVKMQDCLHLKSAVTKINDTTVLINPEMLDTKDLKYLNWIKVDSTEPFAANCLSINNIIIYSTAFPKTYEMLKNSGYTIYKVCVDEIMKAEGAITCCSLIIR